jgi:hypothetical protein
MAKEPELDDFGRHPTLWTISAINWKLENPDFSSRISLGFTIEDPAKEVEMTHTLETVEAPDLDGAISAAHALLDKHAEQAGEYGLELWLHAPQLLPHPEQERLSIRDYKLTAEARKQARSIGLRGRDLEARVARMVRHAVPFEHHTGNQRYRGILLRVEDDVVSWLGLAVPPRRRRRKAK